MRMWFYGQQCQLMGLSVTLHIPRCRVQGIYRLSSAIELVTVGRGRTNGLRITMNVCGHAYISNSVQSRIISIHTAAHDQILGTPPLDKRNRNVLQAQTKRRQVPPHRTTQVENVRKHTTLAMHSHIQKPTQERERTHHTANAQPNPVKHTWPCAEMASMQSHNPGTQLHLPPNPWQPPNPDHRWYNNTRSPVEHHGASALPGAG